MWTQYIILIECQEEGKKKKLDNIFGTGDQIYKNKLNYLNNFLVCFKMWVFNKIKRKFYYEIINNNKSQLNLAYEL